MRELKLRYLIDLVSNIGAKARADARAMQEAQKLMQGAITGTNSKFTDWNSLTAKSVRNSALLKDAITGTTDKFTQLDRVITRVGQNSSTERQIRYMRELAATTEHAERRAAALRERLSTGWQRGVLATAAVAAAGRTLKEPTVQSLSFDRKLAGLANTAFMDRDAAGRISGMRLLEGAINASRKQSGGTREQALEALDTMIASGVVSDSDAMLMLPGILKAAVGSGAEAKELSTIAIRAQQSFKVPAKDVPMLLSSAMAAGQAGGFELKDMAKWLPQQMAMARNLGMTGADNFAKLTAWNQASVITSGTKDEAGNNLRDLLNELNTPHFRDYMAKELLNGGKQLGKGQKATKQKEIDDVFLEYQSRGVDKVSATIELMDKLFARNGKYAELQKKLQALPKDDQDGRREILEAMAAQVQGTTTGKVFHNQQSLMAFLGIANNREYVADVLTKVRAERALPDSLSAVGIGHEVIRSTADFKLEQAKEDAKVAEKAAMDKATPTIGRAAEAFGDVVSASPEGSGMALLGAKATLAAAGVLHLLGTLFGRGGAQAAAGGAAGASAAGGAASAAAVASSTSRLGMLARGMSLLNPLMLIEMLTGPSEEDIAKLRAMDRVKAGWRGQGFDDPRRLDRPGGPVGAGGPFRPPSLLAPQLDFLTLTAPGAPGSPIKAGQTTEVKVGEGRIAVDVTLRDERASVSTSVVQQPSLVKIDTGRTNPGSFGGFGGTGQ